MHSGMAGGIVVDLVLILIRIFFPSFALTSEVLR